ncbi:Arginine repressor, C-terminal [Acididesulfobacillus acetoxydans]|uniref:Arginine repressor n=1 Tax=Acididesulfobacillus acetoxydans TaxID=1561005 RepID=A0A8S0W3Y6_9FIRM|nr:arginine repressor [Acididesulfobacillus acetoxydans]CAA7602108.1 Arginine repressor, C-terminal [Acididesulfobacillus acetoxydans]CEJ08049.1 Arginine repressor [Acididesulfobacillus acetoxydans]
MKTRRQMKIQELITQEAVHTQEELADKLRQAGFEVTQATVSRDIKELGLVKVAGQNEEYHYALAPVSHPINYSERLKRLAREAVVSVNSSENIILIRTIPGNAHALAELIDNSEWKDIIGTVAGDNTILMVVKPKEATPAVMARLERLMG